MPDDKENEPIPRFEPSTDSPPSLEDERKLDHENRIRALEGQPPIAMEELLKQQPHK